MRDTEYDAKYGNYIREHIATYINSKGTEGHIRSMKGLGGYDLSPHLLLRYPGRKSGRVYTVPLTYGVISGAAVVCASKGGADDHPEWYLNVIAAQEVNFQIATQAFRATWREPQGAERIQVWDYLQALVPQYTVYQTMTQRVLPIIMLTPVEPVPLFT